MVRLAKINNVPDLANFLLTGRGALHQELWWRNRDLEHAKEMIAAIYEKYPDDD